MQSVRAEMKVSTWWPCSALFVLLHANPSMWHRLAGDREFGTVNRNTYKHHGQVRPVSMIVHKPEIASQSRSKFESKTMNSTDYSLKDVRPPKPCAPARPTIDLKFNNKLVADCCVNFSAAAASQPVYTVM